MDSTIQTPESSNKVATKPPAVPLRSKPKLSELPNDRTFGVNIESKYHTNQLLPLAGYKLLPVRICNLTINITSVTTLENFKSIYESDAFNSHFPDLGKRWPLGIRPDSTILIAESDNKTTIVTEENWDSIAGRAIVGEKLTANWGLTFRREAAGRNSVGSGRS